MGYCPDIKSADCERDNLGDIVSQFLWSVAEWLTLTVILIAGVYYGIKLINGIIEQVRKL